MNKICLGYFLFYSLFFSLTSVQANPISNRLFKNLHQYISNNDQEKALYYLRNHSRELVGTDKLLAHYAQGVLGAELGAEEGAYKEALAQFEQAKDLKELSVYINYYRGLIYFKKKHFKSSEKFLKKALAEKKIQKDLFEKINFLYGQINLNARNGKGAYKKLNPLLRSWKGADKRAELLEILLSSSLNKKVFSRGRYCKWFRDLYVDHPINEISRKWGFKEEGFTYKGKKLDCKITLSKMRSRLRRFYLEGLNGEILAHLANVKNKYIHNKLLSSYYYYTGNPDKALALLTKYKDLEKRKGEQRQIARVSYFAGKPERSLAIYKNLYLKEKSKNKRAWLLNEQANLNIEMSNYKEAELLYRQLIKKYPKSKQSRMALWSLPWSMYLGQKYQESYAGFLKLSEEVRKRPYRFKRIDLKQVQYWSARALQKAGQENLSVLIYKELSEDTVVSYYSLLSALRLAEVAKRNQVLLGQNDFLKLPWIRKNEKLITKRDKFLDSFRLATRMPSSLMIGNDLSGLPLVDLSKSFPKKKSKPKILEESNYSKHMQRYTYLSRLGFWKNANAELVLVRKLSKTKKLKEKLLGFFESTKDYSSSARLASLSFYRERHFSNNEKSFKFWSKSYPKAFEEDVDGASKMFSVSKNLIWGLMRAESFF